MLEHLIGLAEKLRRGDTGILYQKGWLPEGETVQKVQVASDGSMEVFFADGGVSSLIRSDLLLPRIFVQIASYRDPELVPTIRSALDSAKYPDRISFGVCWQRDPATDSWDIFGDLFERLGVRFRYLDIHYKQAQGACWARHKIQTELYLGEEYTLHVDSHTRFCQDWDEKLLKLQKMMERRGLTPVISSYPGTYYPDRDPEGRSETPLRIILSNENLDGDGIPNLVPDHIQNYRDFHGEPERGIFAAAGFMFGPGDLCRKVPHDPQMYFKGEETAISARLWTHGYDIFVPTKETILWHFYERHGATRHWTDHPEWHKRHQRSIERFRKLMLLQDTGKEVLGEFGLGTKRSLESFYEVAKVRPILP